MKTLVISAAGNVGKTTLSRALAATHPETILLHYTSPIATPIADPENGNAKDFWPCHFKALYFDLMAHSHVVVDVSLLIINTFLEQAALYRSTLAEFDSVLVPTDRSTYGEQRLQWTIEKLQKLGVPGEKIRPISNAQEYDLLIEEQLLKQFDPMIYGGELMTFESVCKQRI